MNAILFIIPLIISATVVLALINEESPLINTVTKAKATEYQCEPKSLSEVKLSFPVKEPTYLPEGYRLEVVDPYSFSVVERSEDSYRVVLFYAKEPMCHGIIPNGFTDDIIAINVVNIQSKEVESTLGDVDKDPLAYFMGKVEEYNSVIPDVARLKDKPVSEIPPTKLIKVNDYIGYAREPTQAYTVVIFHDEDGNIKEKMVVEEHGYKRAGFLTFYHSKDKVLYTISSILPVEEMLKIAESIP
jgi:hypothetical protein